MRPTENIEKLISRVQVESRAEVSKRNLDDALAAQKKATGSANSKPTVLRIIMKNQTTKIAAAAVIIIATVMIISYQFGISIHIVNSSFAEMKKAVNEVPWIHVISKHAGTSGSDKTEFDIWFSPQRKVWIRKSGIDSKIFWSDFLKRERQVYDPKSNTITLSHEYKRLSEMKDAPCRYFASIFGDDLIRNVKINEKLQVLEGQQVRAFSLIKKEDEGDIGLRILTDINNKLPLAFTIEAKDPNGQILMSEQGTFYYPEDGPENIYEVGASKDSIIIDQLPSPDAEELLEICKSYRANFNSYMSIIISGNEPSIEISYIDGDVSQAGCYFKSLTYSYISKMDSDLELLNDKIKKGFDSLLEFIKSESDTDLYGINLWDGKYSYYRCSYIFLKDYSPSYKKSREMGAFHDIYGYAWPYFQPSGKIIEDEYSIQNNLVCLSAYKNLFYFDPGHDYICVRRIMEKYSDETGTHYFVQEVKEMTQTEDGWWYPCKVERIQVNLDNNAEEISRKVTNVTEIYIKKVSEFPNGTFEANNLP